MVDILMPALSPTMTEGKLAKWHKQVGDAVKAGDILAEIETDKATMEFEAVDEGTLSEILVPEGSEHIAVNAPIARIAGEGEPATPAAAKAAPQPAPQPAAPPPAAKAPAPQPTTAPAAPRPAVESEWSGPTNTVTVREALRDAMAEEMRRDGDVFLMGEEVAEYHGAYKVSRGLLEQFGPMRVVDTPIAELGFTGIGVGAAMVGLRPVIEVMTFNFALLAIDQIVNSAAKLRYMSGGQVGCPMVVRGPGGAALQLAAQHSQAFESWYAHIPGLKVVMPATPADAKGLLKSAIRDDNPVVFIEGEMLYNVKGEVPDEEYLTPLGKADVKRPGKDVTIVCHSKTVAPALAAAKTLADEGIDAEVIDLRTIRPLDHETILASVARTNRVVVAEEGWGFAGVGAEVVNIIQRDAFDDLDAPVLRVHQADAPMPYNKLLERAAKTDAPKIVEAVHRVCYRD